MNGTRNILFGVAVLMLASVFGFPAFTAANPPAPCSFEQYCWVASEYNTCYNGKVCAHCCSEAYGCDYTAYCVDSSQIGKSCSPA
jgi:hypothetical protein